MTQSLYDFSRKLSGASSVDDVLWAAAAHMHADLRRRIVLLVRGGGRSADPRRLAAGRAARPAAMSGRALGAAEERAGRLAAPARCRASTIQFRPLRRRARRHRRVRLRAAIAGRADHRRRTSARSTAILDQTAIALDRALLAREAVKAASMQENEKVRDALLSSLSHDLRTPLAAITGAATSLRALGDKMSAAERLELLSSIEEETARLSRFVSNLLDMSRIEAGGLKVKRDLVDVADVVQGAVERSRKAFPKQPVQREPRARSAVRARRRQAARAGAVQPARQCAQICGRQRRDHPRRARKATRSCLASPTRGRG